MCVCVIKLLVYVNICSSFVSLHTKACFLYRISHNCSAWNYVRAAGNFCRTKVAMRVVVHLEYTRTHTFVHCHPCYMFSFAALAQLVSRSNRQPRHLFSTQSITSPGNKQHRHFPPHWRHTGKNRRLAVHLLLNRALCDSVTWKDVQIWKIRSNRVPFSSFRSWLFPLDFFPPFRFSSTIEATSQKAESFYFPSFVHSRVFQHYFFLVPSANINNRLLQGRQLSVAFMLHKSCVAGRKGKASCPRFLLYVRAFPTGLRFLAAAVWRAGAVDLLALALFIFLQCCERLRLHLSTTRLFARVDDAWHWLAGRRKYRKLRSLAS